MVLLVVFVIFGKFAKICNMNPCRHHLHHKSVGAPRFRKEVDMKSKLDSEVSNSVRGAGPTIIFTGFGCPFSGIQDIVT